MFHTEKAPAISRLSIMNSTCRSFDEEKKMQNDNIAAGNEKLYLWRENMIVMKDTLLLQFGMSQESVIFIPGQPDNIDHDKNNRPGEAPEEIGGEWEVDYWLGMVYLMPFAMCWPRWTALFA